MPLKSRAPLGAAALLLLALPLALVCARADEAPTQVRVVTNMGEFVIEVRADRAPLTVANFLRYVREGFYTNTLIHRVVPNFVVQDGDPRGDGWGGPAFVLRDEINPVRYQSGTVGMALSGPDTGGSQFFISTAPAPHLDGEYTLFGHVAAGMDVVDRIRPGDVIQRVEIWDGR